MSDLTLDIKYHDIVHVQCAVCNKSQPIMPKQDQHIVASTWIAAHKSNCASFFFRFIQGIEADFQ